MPKSNAEKVRASAARRRAHARQLGLCIQCCKEEPKQNRKICATCSASSVERNRRRREKNRVATEFHPAIVVYEHAGDVAHEHHFHDGAAQHYKDALVSARTADDRIRILVKLARTLFLGNNPKEASRWLEDALSYYTNDPEQGAKLAELLFERARQLWAEYNFSKALPDLARAIEISKIAGERQLYKFANLRMASYLENLGRLEEAERYFDAVGGVDERDDAVLRSYFFARAANMAAARGMREQAYKGFERALDIAEEETDLHHLIGVWSDYSAAAEAFGDMALVKPNLERALLIARRSQIRWRIPQFCLSYAGLLYTMGHYDLAQNYLREALSYETLMLSGELLSAGYGIYIALETKDDEALAKCTNPNLLVRAFESGVPLIVGPVAAGFARFYAAQGQLQQAKDILHRALSIVRSAYKNWNLCLEVAQIGDMRDIPQARSLLQEHAALPYANVAEACICLFDAFIAHRRNHIRLTHQFASEAIERFKKLEWYAYIDLANTLLPRTASKQRIQERHIPFVEIQSILTPREQQVAGLVLRGLTNHAIAEALAIKETTVESHLSSIMSRIGIRSRYQLVDILPNSRD